MNAMMLQFKHEGEPPTVDDVRRRFHLEVDEIDPNFGVIATDPAASLYTVLVSVESGDRVERALAAEGPRDLAEGVFSNPRIETFGPPEM